MTIGIYALYWDNDDQVYIGQSIDIERRYKEHCKSLESTSCKNYKLLKIYKIYGTLPKLQVLENTTVGTLNIAEISWITEFNSIINGLNIASGGVGSYGPDAAHSLYNKVQILKVFALLLKQTKYPAISLRTKVNISTIKAISNGTKHTWLQDKWPEKYLSLFKDKKSPSYMPVIIVNKQGFKSLVYNKREFAEINSINQGNFISMIKGKLQSCGDWSLFKEQS